MLKFNVKDIQRWHEACTKILKYFVHNIRRRSGDGDGVGKNINPYDKHLTINSKEEM
jgi:hypothetical protein